MALVSVSAGFLRARPELESALPAGVAAPVRELILRMADALARNVRID